jgi:hypothetical protein
VSVAAADIWICPTCRRPLVAMAGDDDQPRIFKCENCRSRAANPLPLAALYAFAALMLGLVGVMIWSRYVVG